MKIFVVAVLYVAFCVAEPPVNSYLPPNAHSAGVPSSEYGAPNGLNTQYGAPNALNTQYGAPSAFNNFDDSIVVNARRQNHKASSGSFLGRSSFGGARKNSFTRKPSSSYGAPGFGAVGSALSRAYGPPTTFAKAIVAPSPVYGVPSGYAAGRFGNNYDDQSEPANYNFEYSVNDEYGNDFGHEETRQDEQAWGRYSVVLPDGRKQIVEYQADESGFKPKISYEEGYGAKNAGYGRGGAHGQSHNGGYNY